MNTFFLYGAFTFLKQYFYSMEAKDRIKILKGMIVKDAKDLFSNYALAMEYNSAGDIKEAQKILEFIIKTDEKYLAAYYQLGKLYENHNKKEKAIEIYKKGAVIAQTNGNFKTLGEINEALWLLEDED
jgi:tetratricopeptide (TPR) repeat protein